MIKKASFAGGCFWCMVKPFKDYKGVKSVVAGYTYGDTKNPTYEEVCKGDTNHIEGVEITYDDELIDYETLLNIFWRQIDPTDSEGQFNDRGRSYITAIFYYDENQKNLAEKSKKELDESGIFDKKIETLILKAKEFYEAEDYHQDYYLKNPNSYYPYFAHSGRYVFQKVKWDSNNKNRELLKEKLDKMEFEVTQNDKTEPPFKNKYHDHKEEGIYVDVVDGEVLFSSKDKFDSGCGWPSFTKPVKDTKITKKVDFTQNMVRMEVRSLKSNSHLGHIFDDAPKELGGTRYCINSASLKFIKKEDMKEKGYEDYLYLFE